MTRELTEQEKSISHMSAFADGLLTTRKPDGTFYQTAWVECDESQYILLIQSGLFTKEYLSKHTVMVEATQELPRRYKFTMTTNEYFQYVKHVAKQAGVTINIDGSITTHDGIKAVYDYQVPGCIRTEDSNA